MRLRLALTALVASVALGLAACSSDSEPSTGSGPSGVTEKVFPVTVKHKYGETTIKKAPTRVAVVGYNDQDYVLALGYTPVMVRNWAGQAGVPDYAKKYVQGAEPQVVDLGDKEINAEKVGATNPDLIVGVYSGMTKTDYEALSRIAPTIAQQGEFIDYGQPWQNTTRQIGAALGQPKKAEELITSTQGKFDTIKKAHPQWQGKSTAVATYSGELAAFANDDSRSRFMRDLGFVIPQSITDMAGKLFYTAIPTERARDLLNVDLLVWDQLTYTQGGKETIQKVPAFATLPAMQANRVLWIEPKNVETAFGWQTILSIPYALDNLVPALEKALPAA